MKIAFLSSGSPDCPLIRISEFSPAEACRLRDAFRSLALGLERSVLLSELAQANNPDRCALQAEIGKMNAGVTRLDDERVSFAWSLSQDSWSEVADLVEPFCQSGGHGFQYLNRWGQIEVVLTPTGRF